jgi:signal transduction histidine kinase
VKEDNFKIDVMRLIRIAAVLWLAYLAASAIIDFGLFNIKPPGRVERYFYITNSVISLLFLMLSFFNPLKQKLGNFFIPLVLTLICALPVIANQVVLRYLFQAPLPAPESIPNRILPFFLIAIVIVAWQYRWRALVIFNLFITMVNLVIAWFYASNDTATLNRSLFAILVQFVSFIAVGFFIEILVSQLNQQSQSLAKANQQLVLYAATSKQLATSQERNRIARELHDTLAHTLSGLSVQLETMKAYWDINPDTAHTILDKALGATRSGLEETRRALTALRASPLDDLGLGLAIQQFAQECSSRAGLNLNLKIIEGPTGLAAEVEQPVFRIAQEAITNAVKHANATTLNVNMEILNGDFNLRVQDNGKGFDTNSEAQTGHFGIIGMEEHARSAGGTITLTSQFEKGTTIELTIAEKR